MGQLNISGALTSGPTSVSSEGAFPSAVFTVPLGWRGGSNKSAAVATGVLTQNLNSPSAFVKLAGVGPTAPVTQGDTLYFKSTSAIELRITTDDGAGGQEIYTLKPFGLFILEFSADKLLELLEAQGTGILEYFVSGQT